MNEEKVRGTVKFFNPHRYFGFIVKEGGEGEVFFHGSDVLGLEPLTEGELVEFEIEEFEKGERTVNVQRVEIEKEGTQKKKS